MQKEILLQILDQSRNDCDRITAKINNSNAVYRLTPQTASVGFIYRHIGEATNVITQFFGFNNEIEATTLGQTDNGKHYDLEESRMLIDKAYSILEELIHETSDSAWLEEIETSLFGKLSRIKVFSITLFHISHHCGQIASAIVKGGKFQ